MTKKNWMIGRQDAYKYKPNSDFGVVVVVVGVVVVVVVVVVGVVVVGCCRSLFVGRE